MVAAYLPASDPWRLNIYFLTRKT
eukprot:COSAG05_NODE_1559_length_4564_cov_2.602240_11_plen_23_part_01